MTPKVLAEVPKDGPYYAARLVATGEGGLAIEYKSPNAMGELVWTTSRYLDSSERGLILSLLKKGA